MVKNRSILLVIRNIVIDFPSYLINILEYGIFISIGVYCIVDFISSKILHNRIMNFSIGLFFITIVINSLVQNFSFDKKFKKIIAEHKKLAIDISFLPLRWVINFGIFRGGIYSAAIMYTKMRVFSITPIVNYLSVMDEFRYDIKPINLIASYLLLLSIIILILCGCGFSIYKYFIK